MRKNCIVVWVFIVVKCFATLVQAQSKEDLSDLSNRGKVIQDTLQIVDGFVVDKVYSHQGKKYQIGRLLLETGQYGPLTLRVSENKVIRDHVAPFVDYLEISRVDLISLKGRPFFFVVGRYQLFLVDIEAEKISPCIQPGVGVEYGEDALSGVMDGFQFFDGDNYLLGVAVSYGLFCFNIADTDRPKELQRYSAGFSDLGQPYFFIEQNGEDGTYNGIISQSDTLKKSDYVSGFYTMTKPAKYLFQHTQLSSIGETYVDPAVDPKPKPFVQLFEIKPNRQRKPWVIDLMKGHLLQGAPATRFLQQYRD